MSTEADLLAGLLDGEVDAADVPADIAELASLAESVSRHITPVPPTDAFRDALREEVLQSAGGAGGTATTTSTATTTTAATGGGVLSAIVAGVAATAVLATSTIAAADRAGPGDLLAGLDRGLESAQLAIAHEERDAELLVDFAAERVLEAVDLVDPAVISELLQRAEALLGDALALGVDQARDLEQLLEPYRGALLTLASRTEDAGVQAQVAQLLDEAGASGATVLPGHDTGAPATGDSDNGEDPDAPAGSSDTDEDSTDGPPHDPTEPVDEPLGDRDEPLDDPTEPLGDLEKPLGDLEEPLDDLDDSLDDATDPLDGATNGLGD